MQTCTSLVLINKFSSDDLDAVKNDRGFIFTVVDMSRAKFPMLTNRTYSLYNTETPSDGVNDKKYVVGGTYYKSKKEINIYEIECSAVPSGTNPTYRDDKCHLDIVSIVGQNTGYYKLKHALFFKVVDITGGLPQYIRVDESTLTPGVGYTFKQGWNTTNMTTANGASNLSVGDIIGVEDVINNEVQYIYYKAEQYYVWDKQSSYNDGEEVTNYYPVLSEAKPAPNNEEGEIVIGGTLYLYRDAKWTEILEENDGGVIRFEIWKNTIETAILPAGIYADDLKDNSGSLNNVWANCNHVKEVRSGSTVATISTGKVATLNVAIGSEEFNRMKGIIRINDLIAQEDADHLKSSVGMAGGLHDGIYTVRESLSSKISAINEATSDVIVLDLKNATGVDKAALQGLNKSTIEYIILPAKQTKDFVCDSTNYYTNDVKNIKDLKAVISSDEDTLVAYVIEPGTLAGARYYATGGRKSGMNGESFMPTYMGLKSITLSGNLNADDISTKGESSGLSGEMHTIETIDLEKAYFPNNNDMNFLEAGFQGGPNDNCHLSKISLPIDPRMKHIPVDCFRNLKSLDSLCIPFNYQYIHNGALYDSNVEHLTTTDSIGGVVIDNGPLTYTLSANLLEIGDAPSPKLNGDGIPQSVETYVFPKENGVLEIYSLATKVPKCYRYSFSYDLTFGYGGQDQTKVYGRNRYFNNGEGKKSFIVLRYPSKEVFKRRKAKGKPVEVSGGTIDDDYALMERKYTDVTKVYTKKDQTGAVDANGDPLLWPARTEGNRAHNQASVGALWDDWSKSYNGENGAEINDGEGGISNGSRSMTRRAVDPADMLLVDLSVGTSTTGVKTDAYTFTPKEDWTRMLQYYNLSMIYDDITYNNIVVHYTASTGDFNVYADGIYNLPQNQNQVIIPLDKTTIDEFTIYNSNSGYTWSTNTENKITIDSIYFTTDGANPKKLYLSLTNGKTASVERTMVGGPNYTFQPIGNVRNMFQYKPMTIPTDKAYKKLVVEFAAPVPKGFNIHAYGERGEFYSLEGKTSYEIPLNGNQIEDFTIFNWDDAYWTDDLLSTTRPDTIRKVEVVRAYFTTDNYEVIAAEHSKYKHDKVANDDKTFDLVDYIGWHQIVLTQAAYYEPVEKKEGEKIKRNYKKTGYCTFCIPYDMTYSQVVKMLGIPASAGNVENYLNGVKQESDVMPDIRQLYSVTRTPGSGSDNNSILFRLSKNLAKSKLEVEYLDFVESEGKVVPRRKLAKDRYMVDEEGNLTATPKPADADPRCIVGGRPYIINAYMPYVNAKDSIPLRNLGLYVMTRYADELNDTASCVNNGKDYYEQLSIYEEKESGQKAGEAKVTVLKADELTMRFAKPYEGHKVQAYSNEDDMTALVYDHEKLDETIKEDEKYYYTMVGQFWEQELPLYAIYMTRKGEWKRYAHDYHIKWDPYKCVIMATPDITSNDFVDSATVVKSLIPDELTKEQIKEDQIINKKDTLTKPYDYVSTFEHFGGGFRNLANCYFPMNYKGTYDWIPAPMKLWFCGRDDSSFEYKKNNTNNTRYIFVMDDEDEIIEYGDEVTNVKAIDTLDGVPQLTGKSRVYNLSGQYMGNNTAGLPRGVYIVDGRKIVVE